MNIDISVENTARLTGLIYDAALDPAQWPVFLDGYAEAMNASCAYLHARNLDSGRLHYAAASNMETAVLASYADHYGGIDSWVGAARDRSTGSVMTSRMLLPDKQLEHSEFYTDFLQPIDIRHICTAIVMNEQSEFAAATVFRPRHKADFGKEERMLADRLWPHLHRATQIQQKLALSDLRVAALDMAIDELTVGVIVLDADARIIEANTVARRILAEGDGLVALDGELVAVHSGDDLPLRQALTVALHPERLTAASGALPVRRRGNPQPYPVMVTPMRKRETAFGRRIPAILVFIGDPDARPVPPLDILRQWFGLTRREAALVSIMAQGSSLAEAAERMRIRRTTARNYMHSIYGKTGTSRQSDLIRLLGSLPSGAQRY